MASRSVGNVQTRAEAPARTTVAEPRSSRPFAPHEGLYDRAVSGPRPLAESSAQSSPQAVGLDFAALPIFSSSRASRAAGDASSSNGFLQGLRVQAKLAMGPGDDHDERAADAAADRVVRASEGDGGAAAVPINPAAATGGIVVEPQMEERLLQRAGLGAPLPGDLRGQMERGFGADFQGVRLHTGAEAAALSRSLGAQAFTHGANIYFAEGKLDPGSTEGRHLLAHELAHVMQQTAGGGDGGLRIQRKAAQESEQTTFDVTGRYVELDGFAPASRESEPVESTLQINQAGHHVRGWIQRHYHGTPPRLSFYRFEGEITVDRPEGMTFEVDIRPESVGTGATEGAPPALPASAKLHVAPNNGAVYLRFEDAGSALSPPFKRVGEEPRLPSSAIAAAPAASGELLRASETAPFDAIDERRLEGGVRKLVTLVKEYAGASGNARQGAGNSIVLELRNIEESFPPAQVPLARRRLQAALSAVTVNDTNALEWVALSVLAQVEKSGSGNLVEIEKAPAAGGYQYRWQLETGKIPGVVYEEAADQIVRLIRQSPRLASLIPPGELNKHVKAAVEYFGGKAIDAIKKNTRLGKSFDKLVREITLTREFAFIGRARPVVGLVTIDRLGPPPAWTHRYVMAMAQIGVGKEIPFGKTGGRAVASSSPWAKFETTPPWAEKNFEGYVDTFSYAASALGLLDLGEEEIKKAAAKAPNGIAKDFLQYTDKIKSAIKKKVAPYASASGAITTFYGDGKLEPITIPGGPLSTIGLGAEGLAGKGYMFDISRANDAIAKAEQLSQPYAPLGVDLDITDNQVVHFDVDSANLTDAGLAAVREMCAVQLSLLRNASTEMSIKGYASRTGSASHNLSLSQQRADQVRLTIPRVLGSSFKVQASKIVSKGLGERPAELAGQRNNQENEAFRKVEVSLNGGLVLTLL